MCQTICVIVVIAIYCSVANATESKCYSDFCHKNIEDLPNDGLRCLLTSIERDVDCRDLRFNSFEYAPPSGVSSNGVKLSAYVASYPEFHTKFTAFNLTIKDAAVQRLTTRYQDMANPENSHCRHVKLFGVEHSTMTPELFISCPFANSSFEGISYKLEYLISWDNYEIHRKFIFRVPDHLSIDASDVKTYTPFFYIDASDAHVLSLYIQQLPEKFNVTSYKVWMMDNSTDDIILVDLKSVNIDNHLQYNFPINGGTYYFKVAAVHADCGYDGCTNSTSPPINIKPPTRRLLIMIISVVWIPPVILYAIYYFYKLYRKQEILARLNCKPNCLLVYSPTHLAHVNVMSNLAKYLRNCNINAMIDIFDIPETDSKDPGLWCNAAFRNADFIVVVISPVLPVDHTTVPVIYHNMDSHALRLIKENYSQRNKKYITLEFPYCKSHDVPEEATMFKRLRIPENLDKFVRYIHGIEYLRFLNVSNRELIDSINLATSEISRDRANSPKNGGETDDLLPTRSLTKQDSNTSTSSIIKVDEEKLCQTKNFYEDTSEDFKNQRIFGTKINELNLLGEDSAVEEQESARYISSVSDGEFRIDRLDL